MLHTMKHNKQLLMALLLLIMLGGCSALSPPSVATVPPALIPSLSESARQPTRSETFSQTVSKDTEAWEKKLTSQGITVNPASGSTTPSPPQSVNK